MAIFLITSSEDKGKRKRKEKKLRVSALNAELFAYSLWQRPFFSNYSYFRSRFLLSTTTLSFFIISRLKFNIDLI
jgi:hypothetical protein